MPDEPPPIVLPGSPRELQDQAPVSWQSNYGGFWLVWRHRDVREVLADPLHFSSSQTLGTLLRHDAGAGIGAIPVNLDPPLHEGYRRLLAWLIAAASDRAGKSLVSSVVDEVLSSARRDDLQDFTQSFAVPVAAKTLFRFLGFPAHEETVFLEGARSMVCFPPSGASDGGQGRAGPSRPRSVVRASLEDYVRSRVADARYDTTGGPLSALMSTTWRTHFGSPVVEATNMLMTIIEAGLVNCSAALENVMGHLVIDHASREALLADPAMAGRIAEELLRLYPVVTPVRTVRRDIVLAGVTLHVGEAVVLSLNLANRDDALFHQPDQLLLDRVGHRHLAFGAGPHSCLGATLVRQILTSVLASMKRVMRHYVLLAG